MPILIFCIDAYCQWSFAFKDNMLKLHDSFKDYFQIEVLSGGLLQPVEPTSIEVIAPSLVEIENQVTQTTGIRFGTDFLWHLHNPQKSDWFPNSLMPATALCIFKEEFPLQQIAFANDVLIALQEEGRDLTDPEAYRHLVEKYGLNESDFYSKLKTEVYQQKAKKEFEICLQLKANAFPSIYIQNSKGKLFFVQSGWSNFYEIEEKIKSFL